ncbi:MAG: 16S rRNA (adenine(1518)-N(6)/adenine(1519)-N(6))-dimethyltransferase RsmA [bacterium]|nr:16S rRNA (adenine(1518)-N(6)/adenine(1519)-N(6))-dimethyltransferase RsmA [bacterium]
MLKRKNKLLLESADIRPIKHMGQNFLVSEEIIEKIILEAKIKTGETILEVGPGTGNLTMALLATGAKVVAIEKDSKLVHLLISNFQFLISKKKLKVIEQDILSFDEMAIKSPYRVIANIPYYLTGKLIQKFLLSANKPSELILMVQKEVGERITAQPPKANFLSSLVQFLAETKILFKVGKENFWPQPKVDSALIKLTPYQYTPSIRSYARDTVGININNNEEFIEFLKMVFRQPRQTLFNNLRKYLVSTSQRSPAHAKLDSVFQELGFDKKIRAQNLGKEDLVNLFSLLGY